MRRVFALLGLSAAMVVAWLFLLPARAVARVEGPCTATIGNVDITRGHDDPNRAVPLQSGTEVPIAGTAGSRVTDLTYTVRIAGGGIQVGSVVIGGTGREWAGTVDLSTISNATVGLFAVTLDVETAGADCTGAAYVCIEGRNPFTTVAGIGATVFGLGGAILLVLSLTGARRTSLGRSAVQGFAGGAIASLGGAILLQQFCTLPLTGVTALTVPVLLGVAGAIGASVLHRTGSRGARPPRPSHAERPPTEPAGAPTEPAGAPTEPAGAPTEPVGAPTEPVGAPTEPVGAPTQPVGVGGSFATVERTAKDDPTGAPPVSLPPPPSTGDAGAATASPVAKPDRTCPICGTANDADAAFCTNCGEKLT
jgi:hypothetical protein